MGLSLLLALTALSLPAAQTAATEIDYAGLYAKGVTFEEFVNAATARKSQWQQNYERAEPSRDVREGVRLKDLPWRILVVATASCSDSVNTIPYLAKLVNASEGKLQLRIVEPSIGRPVMEAWRTPDGRAATPTVVLMRTGRPYVRGWSERPAELQTWYLEKRNVLDRADLAAQKQKWYDDDAGRKTLDEIVAMMIPGTSGERLLGRAREVRGLVLRVDRNASTMTVSHEAIDGFMDAMVMPFEVAPASALAGIRPGDRVSFHINSEGKKTFVDRVTLLSAAPADDGILASPAKRTLVAPGERVPDFTLTDHRGQPVSLSSLRGKVVAVTFIYTRCPLPDYCPRIMTNLGELRDRFAARLGKDLALLTVTFDPQYDTPEKLASYAQRYKADVPGWHLLTGSAEAIGRVCSLFGVEFWPEEGLITHTLQTAVVDRQGRMVGSVEGKDYSARQLGDFVEQALRY
jgi:protein SCO1/2